MKKITTYHTSVLALLQNTYIRFQGGKNRDLMDLYALDPAKKWNPHKGPMDGIPLLHIRFHQVSLAPVKTGEAADGLIGKMSPDSVIWIVDGLKDYYDNLQEQETSQG